MKIFVTVTDELVLSFDTGSPPGDICSVWTGVVLFPNGTGWGPHWPNSCISNLYKAAILQVVQPDNLIFPRRKKK